MALSDREIEESIVNGFTDDNKINDYLERLRILKTNVIKDIDPSYCNMLGNVFNNYEKIRLYYPDPEYRQAQIVCILMVFKKNKALKKEMRSCYNQWKALNTGLKYLVENERMVCL